MAQFFDNITYSPPGGPTANNSFGYPSFALYITSDGKLAVSYGEVGGNAPIEMKGGNDYILPNFKGNVYLQIQFDSSNYQYLQSNITTDTYSITASRGNVVKVMVIGEVTVNSKGYPVIVSQLFTGDPYANTAIYVESEANSNLISYIDGDGIVVSNDAGNSNGSESALTSTELTLTDLYTYDNLTSVLDSQNGVASVNANIGTTVSEQDYILNNQMLNSNCIHQLNQLKDLNYK
jgi:hypothetical protein